jgi:hypothetical protein
MNSDLIRALVEDAELANRLYLVKNNVPFDVAMSLEEHETMAYAIVFGTFDGGEWDWAAMRWKKD